VRRSPRLEVRRARRAGTKDAKAGIPTREQQEPPFELRSIAARHDARISRLVGEWRERDAALARDADRVREELAALGERVTLLNVERQRLLADHERRAASEDERLARLQAQLEEFPTPLATDADLEPPIGPPLSPPSPSALGASALAPPPASGPPPASAPPPTPDGADTLIETGPATASVGVALDRLEVDPSLDGHPRARSDEPEAIELGPRGIGRLAYWSLISLIVAGEFPLNAFAFRLFGEGDLLTYVMTLTIAVALVMLAHFAGVLLARERTATERWLLAATLALPVTGIAVIAIVRDGYLRLESTIDGLGPWLGALAFGLVNVVIFCAAATLSYAHHDPRTRANHRAAQREAERERARAERRRTRRSRDLAERQRREREAAARRDAERRAAGERDAKRRSELERTQRAADAEAALERRAKEVRLQRERIAEAMRPLREARREREGTLAATSTALEDALATRVALEGRVEAIEAQRSAARRSAEAALREAIRIRESVLLAYCSANVRAREDRTSPPALRELPPLELPDAFAALADRSGG
jgi:hypothetical protein